MIFNWQEYINNYDSFSYIFTIPISSDDFRKRILDFDFTFLSLGDKYGFFKYENNDLIRQYIEKREQDSFSNNYPWVGLLRFEDYEDTCIKNMHTLLPNQEGNLIPIPYHHRYDNSCIEASGDTNLHWSELSKLDFWYENISCYINSSSTIWFQDIQYGIDENRQPLNFEPSVDNHFFAYRITPRFNSFLRDLTQKVQELSGTIKLDEYDSKYTTEQGIFLNNRIIYQEDIDEGRLKLPE